jgi:hypothetical protein
MISPIHPRCEYRENPLEIDCAQPRLSWWLQSAPPDARGVQQSAYQILVTSDRGAELWDSGKVKSSQNIHVSYDGNPLASAQRVRWKVRVWDAHDAPSDWSESATWTMGLLSNDDWQAHWISAPLEGKSNRLPLFRKRVRIDKSIARAIAFFCGLGQHELHVNGQVVGQDLLDPGWTNYAKTCLYATHDVTSLLRPQENMIGLMLGNGMYNVVGGRYVKFKGSFGPPKLIFQMLLEFTDGTSTTVVSDESWESAPGPITFSCIYGGEDYDSRLEVPGWDDPLANAPHVRGGQSTEWKRAVVCQGPGGQLRSQMQPPIRVMKSFSPANVTEPKPGIKVYDFGQNMSGRVQISLKADAGTTVKLTTSELLDEQGLVNQKPTGSPVTYSYTCRGGSEIETWRPRFTYTGFRYVQAEGAPLDAIDAQFTYSSSHVVGQFSCSNDLLNRIHALIDRAIESNMQCVLTDCPHREKLGWLEQSHLMGDAIMFNYDVANRYAKISRDMRDAQHADGCVPTIAPQYTQFNAPHDVFNDSPEWGSAVVINPWLLYKRYGDRRILEENYDAMKGYVEYLHKRDKDGIVEYGLGDWYDIGPGQPGLAKLTSPGLTATAVYFQDVQIMKRVAETLGFKDDASRYAGLAQRILQAFNARFFDAATKRYDRNSQTASAMPLVLDMVPEQHRAAVLENLTSDIRAHDDHITAGDVGFHYVVRALGEADRSNVMLRMLLRTDPPSYGSQLARGATTLTEAWDANPRNSQNHFMLGHAEIWFYEYLAGIRLDLSQSPPRQIVIRPAILRDDLTWAKAEYQSVLGPIASHWRRQDRDLRLNVSIPENAEATVYLTAANLQGVRESGKPLSDRADIRRLGSSNGQIVCEIGSGQYHFETEIH